MLELVLGIIGIFAILIVANILRGLIANKTGYARNGGTNLGNAISDVSRQAARAKDLNKQIYAKRDSFRNLPMIEAAIAKVFEGTTPQTLPAKVKMNGDGIFVLPFDSSLGKYNPVWQQRVGVGELPSFDVMNGCAVFLLIQEKYPNLYTFENTKVDDFDYGEVEQITLHLNSAKDVVAW